MVFAMSSVLLQFVFLVCIGLSQGQNEIEFGYHKVMTEFLRFAKLVESKEIHKGLQGLRTGTELFEAKNPLRLLYEGALVGQKSYTDAANLTCLQNLNYTFAALRRMESWALRSE